jgi:hypothetical protein
MFPEWDRIDRVFKVKTSGKLRETRILSADFNSPIPLIDAAIDRIITQIKDNKTNVDISDKRINKKNFYSRLTEIKYKSKVITIEIPDKDAPEALVTGLKKKLSIKLNKSGKISSSIIKKIVEGAKSLKDTRQSVNINKL